jgi:sugar phosphate isomerase/epimerase
MPILSSRRSFLQTSLFCAGATGLADRLLAASEEHKSRLSLHELSLKRRLASGETNHLDLAQVARTQFGLSAIEYASPFFAEQVRNEKYLKEMNKRAAEHEVRQLLITVDGAGRLGAPVPKQRRKAVFNHLPWVEAAEKLGCHSIEVGISSAGTPDEQSDRVAEGTAMLCDYADKHHINVLAGCRDRQSVEVGWILDLIEKVDHAAFGLVPSFALLAAAQTEDTITRLIAFAKGMCAAAQEFDAQGRETSTDFSSVVSTIHHRGYGGYVGIHYRGNDLDEIAGIRATITLLEAARGKNK